MKTTKAKKRNLLRSMSFTESSPVKVSKVSENDENANAVLFKQGRPVLPPIRKYDFNYDPWLKSKLMTHSKVKEQHHTLMKY